MAICSFIFARSLVRRFCLLPIPFVSVTGPVRRSTRAREVIIPCARRIVTSHILTQMEDSVPVASNRSDASEHGQCSHQDATIHVADEEKDLDKNSSGPEFDEGFAYMQRGFTTEIYKIEIRNIPTYVGFKVRGSSCTPVAFLPDPPHVSCPAANAKASQELEPEPSKGQDHSPTQSLFCHLS